MVRKGPYKRREKGPKYSNKDNTVGKVIMYLYFVGKSNKYNLIQGKNSGLNNQEWNAFSTTLDKMVEDELIKKYQSEDAKNVTMYALLDKGKEFAKFVEDNYERTPKHPIFTLEAFYDIKYLRKADS